MYFPRFFLCSVGFFRLIALIVILLFTIRLFINDEFNTIRHLFSDFSFFGNTSEKELENQTFKQPIKILSQHNFLNHTLKICSRKLKFSNGVSFDARLFDCTDNVGPTFVLKPGDTFELLIENELENNNIKNIQSITNLNTFNSANSTNIHTHGIHISPSGIADNILER